MLSTYLPGLFGQGAQQAASVPEPHPTSESQISSQSAVTNASASTKRTAVDYSGSTSALENAKRPRIESNEISNDVHIVSPTSVSERRPSIPHASSSYGNAIPPFPTDAIAILQEASTKLLDLLVRKNAPDRERQLQVAVGTIRTCPEVDFVPHIGAWSAIRIGSLGAEDKDGSHDQGSSATLKEILSVLKFPEAVHTAAPAPAKDPSEVSVPATGKELKGIRKFPDANLDANGVPVLDCWQTVASGSKSRNETLASAGEKQRDLAYITTLQRQLSAAFSTADKLKKDLGFSESEHVRSREEAKELRLQRLNENAESKEGLRKLTIELRVAEASPRPCDHDAKITKLKARLAARVTENKGLKDHLAQIIAPDCHHAEEMVRLHALVDDKDSAIFALNKKIKRSKRYDLNPDSGHNDQIIAMTALIGAKDNAIRNLTEGTGQVVPAPPPSETWVDAARDALATNTQKDIRIQKLLEVIHNNHGKGARKGTKKSRKGKGKNSGMQTSASKKEKKGKATVAGGSKTKAE